MAAGFLVCGYEKVRHLLCLELLSDWCETWNLANPATPYDFHISSEMPFAHLQRDLWPAAEN